MINKTIILDPGHSNVINGFYPTPGKRSPVWKDKTQLFEGEFNHDVCSRIEFQLNQLGIPVVNLASNTGDKPLSVRVHEANQIKNSILFSVHANAGGGSGFEVFTSPGETKSDKIATIVMEEFEREFPTSKTRKDFTDGDADKEANFTIINKTIMPAVLTENFFMDNEHECREYLMRSDGRQRIANFHVAAIKRVLKY